MTPFAEEGTPTPYNTDGVLWVSSVKDFARSLGIIVSDVPLHDVVQESDTWVFEFDFTMKADEEDSLTGDDDG